MNEKFLAEVHFLCDMFGQLNTLNLEIQFAVESLFAYLVERLCAFKTKLTIFTTDLRNSKLMHFPQLRAFMITSPGAHITHVMTDFMTKLTGNLMQSCVQKLKTYVVLMRACF